MLATPSITTLQRSPQSTASCDNRQALRLPGVAWSWPKIGSQNDPTL